MFYQQEKYDQEVQNHHQLIDLRKDKVMNEIFIDKQPIMNHRGNDFQHVNVRILTLKWKSIIVFIILILVDLLLIQYPEIIYHLIQL